MFDTYQELMTVGEVAKVLRLKPVTIRNMIQRGNIFAIKIGSSYKIPKWKLLETYGGIDEHAKELF